MNPIIIIVISIFGCFGINYIYAKCRKKCDNNDTTGEIIYEPLNYDPII